MNIDFFTVVLEKGDIILMCSDGLTNMLEDRQILEIVREPRLLCDRAHELVRAANNNGGKDNIAVILVEPFAEDLP